MGKYVVVLGGLMSGLGKGIVTSSITKLLRWHHANALPLKFDGYLNYDCGTMNPYRHGEVFVLSDGGEVDMDFGNYERFLNVKLNRDFSITGGKIFSEIITKERKGDYLGYDVQFVPHVTDLIKSKLREVYEKYKLDVLVIEVGGTVGDIENSYFIEALRQLALEEKVVFVLLTYVPVLKSVGEQKTKPTQLALRTLMSMGIRPDVIIARSEKELEESVVKKLALFSNLPTSNIFSDPDIDNIYTLPQYFLEKGLDRTLLNYLGIQPNLDLKQVEEWRKLTEKNINKEVKIAIVGKYVKLKDAYASVKEALAISGMHLGVKVNIDWIESEKYEQLSADELSNYDGIIVPGGFGKRGIEGMIRAIEFARKHNIPYLGLCLGMQLMAIEFARNVAGLENANSTEFDEHTPYPVVDLMEDQRSIEWKGGTMRLGEWKAKLLQNTEVFKAYKQEFVIERHRHRYEINPNYVSLLTNKGLIVSGINPEKGVVEFMEWSNGLGIGTQAHAEFTATAENPSPLFNWFLSKAIAKDLISRNSQ